MAPPKLSNGVRRTNSYRRMTVGKQEWQHMTPPSRQTRIWTNVWRDTISLVRSLRSSAEEDCTLMFEHRNRPCWNDRYRHPHLLGPDPRISWRAWSNNLVPGRRWSSELGHGELSRNGISSTCGWSNLRLPEIVHRSSAGLRCWHRLLVWARYDTGRRSLLTGMYSGSLTQLHVSHSSCPALLYVLWVTVHTSLPAGFAYP